MTKLASLGLALAGCVFARATDAAPPPPPVFPFPTLVTNMTNGVNVDIRINDLPLTRYELDLHPSFQNQIDIPPYYWRRGTNTITIRFVGDLKNNPNASLDIIVANLEASERGHIGDPPLVPKHTLARLTPKFTGCADGDFDKRCEQSATFTLPGTNPAWSWTSAPKITDTPANRDGLRKAYVAFHKDLVKLVPRNSDLVPIRGRASKAALDRYKARMRTAMPDVLTKAAADVDDLVILASHHRSRLEELDFEDADLSLEILGDGTHARLWRKRIPLLWFVGGAHDAPAGTMGPFSIGFDVWFRLVDGKWVPAAIWRTKPMVTLPS